MLNRRKIRTSPCKCLATWQILPCRCTCFAQLGSCRAELCVVSESVPITCCWDWLAGGGLQQHVVGTGWAEGASNNMFLGLTGRRGGAFAVSLRHDNLAERSKTRASQLSFGRAASPCHTRFMSQVIFTIAAMERKHPPWGSSPRPQG
jgi:hypothetical protein